MSRIFFSPRVNKKLAKNLSIHSPKRKIKSIEAQDKNNYGFN